MIKITIEPNRISFEGHAGYAEPGRDIVCAGVSALVQTLTASIEALTDDLLEYDIGEDEQITKVYFRNPSEQTKLLIDSFFIGVDMIVDEYPDCVRIIWEVRKSWLAKKCETGGSAPGRV